MLAVAAACTLAGAKTFREIGDQAADLPQNVLRDLGGRVHPLRRKTVAPSETRIRTLLHLIDTEILDGIIGGWLRQLAEAGKLDGLLTAIAIDGKWLRGVLDGQVKLFSAMRTRRRPSSPSTGSRITPTRSRRSRSCWSTWTCPVP
jgi:hypothetical protein